MVEMAWETLKCLNMNVVPGPLPRLQFFSCVFWSEPDLWKLAVLGSTLGPGLNHFLNHDHRLSFLGDPRGTHTHTHTHRHTHTPAHTYTQNCWNADHVSLYCTTSLCSWVHFYCMCSPAVIQHCLSPTVTSSRGKSYLCLLLRSGTVAILVFH